MSSIDVHARLASVVENLHEGFQIVDRELRYVYLNDAAVGHARRPREELLGRTMQDCYPGIEHTDLFGTLRSALTTGQSTTLTNQFAYPDGTVRSFELSVQPMPEGLVILSTDVTERLDLYAQLRQAQKLEAIGRLAGGVAHDFNNLLTVIASFTRLVMDDIEAGSAREDLEQVLKASERAAALTRKLLAFSRTAPMRTEVLDVSALVREMHRVIERIIGEDIRITLRLADGSCLARADPTGLEQVLMNLVVNARDAMPAGGSLTIETEHVHFDEELRMRWGRLVPPGDYVVLAVTDAGCGVSPDIIDRIFDPFFTTKPVGIGTGLGLSVCLGIVEQAGGYIGVYSEVGRGTTVRIYLPHTAGPHQSKRIDRLTRPAGGQEVIGVVEDDETIRRIICRALRGAGYRVVEIEDLATANEDLLALDRLDLLLTDVILPGVSGPALAASLRARRPSLRALFVSGYTGTALAEQQVIRSTDAFLDKPFTPDRLLHAVRLALD